MKNKQMPYRLPDGFIDESKIRNRAAVARAAAAAERRMGVMRWAAPAMATLLLAAAVVGYTELYTGRAESPIVEHVTMEQLVAMMQNAPNDVVFDMACDAEEYPDDYSLF